MAVLPVPIIVNGVPDMLDCWDYYPGDPIPSIVHRDQQNFKYDAARDAFLPWVAPPPPAKPTGVGDVLAVVIYGVFLVGLCGLLLAALWWLIIPVAVIAGLVKLIKG